MSTRNAEIYRNARSKGASSFSTFFFLIGAPHIYSVLRQRQQRDHSILSHLAQKVIAFLVATVVGATGLLAFS